MNKILLVIPTLKAGGAERVMAELANEWSEKGYSVHLITWYKHTPYYHLNEKVSFHKLDYIASFSHDSEGQAQATKRTPLTDIATAIARKRFFRSLKANIKTLLEIRIYKKLRRVIEQISPNAILSFATGNNILVLLALRKSAMPIFVSERSLIKKDEFLLERSLRLYTYKWAKLVILQTNDALQQFIDKTGFTKCEVIPNPVRKIAKYPLEKQKNILSVGRLEEVKGHRYLLQVFSALKAPGWRLVIVGEGTLRRELMQLACDLGVSDRVDFQGQVTEIDVWYGMARVFVLPSLYEGFPNALCEAMAAGLACVSFDCNNGPRDIIIDNYNGYLVPVGNIVLLREKIQFLIDHPDEIKLVGSRAAMITEKLGIENVAARFARVIFPNTGPESNESLR